MAEHDGCVGCRYDYLGMTELPCGICRGTLPLGSPFYEKCADMYEPEMPENPY